MANSFVQVQVNETYDFIWKGKAPPISETDWSPAWIAVQDETICALMLTSDDYVDDLWVARPFRSQGIGSQLLSKGEQEIRGRGHSKARLRVVAGNDKAIAFYQRHGWRRMRQYPHERLPIMMIDFEKELS